jgi:pimeloyl-ACP methyl ester carboxylesterase
MAELRQYTPQEIREGEEFQAMALPIWREALVGLDWLSLRASAVYRAIGVPHGTGSAVVLVPGFLGSDRYLGDLHGWLRRIGYQPHMSGIGRNVDCPNVLADRLRQTIDHAYAQTERKVHLIGHSLGGVIARSAAVRWPELAASVITMASPFRGIHAHPLILEAQALVRGRIMARSADPTVLENCYTGHCSCDFVDALRQPFPEEVPHTAIYTKTDGVVDWHRCINEDPDHDIEVSGTHVGLVFNPQVYRHIADRLALAEVGQGVRT